MGASHKLVLQDLVKAFGDVKAVDGVNLVIDEGTFVSFLGPSGCGKTTTLRLIAGLEMPTSGTVVMDNRVLSGDNIAVPPEKRRMGMVFQSYALWPHMTVYDNIAYGLQLKKQPREQIAQTVREVLNMVNMAGYGSRYPTQLSGGQQQRVALARAVATEPEIILLDEPLSNLDAVLRETMRFEIRNLQRRLGTTSIYVTHSQDEALALSDSVVVMSDGKIIQTGAPLEVYHRPRTRFVAGFVGLANILKGTTMSLNGTRAEMRLETGEIVEVEVGDSGCIGENVSIMIRPENLRIVQGGENRGGSNRLAGIVENGTFTGSIVDYFVRLRNDAGTVRVQSTPPVIARSGDSVVMAFHPNDCVVLED